MERDLDQPSAAASSTTTSAALSGETGLVFGGFDDVLGGMTLAEVRSRGWMLDLPGGGDGCTSHRARRGLDAIDVNSKNGTDVVSTVTIRREGTSGDTRTARIRSSTATYAQISAAYPDAAISYNPPITFGPSAGVGRLIVSSDDHPDRVIAFTAYPAPDTPTPPSDFVFTQAQAGTLSGLTGGSFGCA